jgi:hypothetical protein
MTEGYRSYVVRVRRRGVTPDGIRIDVEDLIGGRRTALTGSAARDLADGLEAAVTEGIAGTTGATQPGPAVVEPDAPPDPGI